MANHVQIYFGGGTPEMEEEQQGMPHAGRRRFRRGVRIDAERLRARHVTWAGRQST
jgi:hypothetical protein